MPWCHPTSHWCCIQYSPWPETAVKIFLVIHISNNFEVFWLHITPFVSSCMYSLLVSICCNCWMLTLSGCLITPMFELSYFVFTRNIILNEVWIKKILWNFADIENICCSFSWTLQLTWLVLTADSASHK